MSLTLDDLPNEIIEEIASLIGENKLSLVNKHFSELCLRSSIPYSIIGTFLNKPWCIKEIYKVNDNIFLNKFYNLINQSIIYPIVWLK